MSTFAPKMSLRAISEAMRFEGERTGAAENAGDLDELDGDLGGIHDGFWSGQLLQRVAKAREGRTCARVWLGLEDWR
jgi:hypothetical protein